MVVVYRRSFSCDSTTITSLDNYIRDVTLHTRILEEMTVFSKTWSHSRRLNCFIAMYTYIPVKLSTGNYTNIVMMYICLNKYRGTNKCERNSKGKSRMDNPETLTALGTQYTGRRQTKQ